MKFTKFYLVPAPIMESNFPDEFANGTYPGKSITSFYFNEIDVNELTVVSNNVLAALEKDEAKLAALEQGGVDNWEGYDFAMEKLND